MFNRSATTTPGPSKGKYDQGESFSWVNDWYSPETTDPKNNSILSSIKLKGWYKVYEKLENGKLSRFNAENVLDLSQWKYKKEVKDEDDKNTTETLQDVDPSKNDLVDALSMNKNEGQISGLGVSG